MRCLRFIKAACLALLAALCACMSSTDPGMDLRYNVSFTSPSQLAGKLFSWASMPVKLRYNACAVAGCTADGEAAVKRGIEFWQKNATLYGEIQTTYSSTPDVDVTYQTSLGGSVIGVCGISKFYQDSRGKYYAELPLTLKIATTVGGSPINTKDLEYVAAHEMGHCLGIWDHSPRDGDLMNAYLSSETKYSARDLNSIRFLYSKTSDLGTYNPSTGITSQQLEMTNLSVESPPLLRP